MAAQLKVKRGPSGNLSSLPVVDGQLLFTTDTKKIYLDNGTERLQIGGGTITTGSANGTIAVDGVDIAVKGLGSNAYTNTEYLPVTGGKLKGSSDAPLEISSATEDGAYIRFTNKNGTILGWIGYTGQDNPVISGGSNDINYTILHSGNTITSGYNLCYGTKNADGWSHSFATTTATSQKETHNGIQYVRFIKDNQTETSWKYTMNSNLDLSKLKDNTYYTVSFDVCSSVSGNIALVGIMSPSAEHGLAREIEYLDNAVTAGIWKRVSFRFKTVNSIANVGLHGQGVYLSVPAVTPNSEIVLGRLCVQEGKVPGSYTDYESYYDNITSNNYTSYTVTKTGGGASGTWGINVTGNANTANYLNVIAENEIRFNGLNYGNMWFNHVRPDSSPAPTACTDYYFGNGQRTVYGVTLHAGGVNFDDSVIMKPNNISGYGNMYLAGTGKGGYYGILLGDSVNYMNVMSGITHQGLFNEANSNWIIYYNRENDRIGLGTSNVEGYDVTVGGSLKADNLYGPLHGNASTATKLATARSISLGNQLSGSVSFDGSANVTISAALKHCTVNGNGTANFPYHRIAYGVPGTGAYVDSYAILLISANYSGGVWGIIKIGHRTNESGSSVGYSAEWLVRSGNMPVDAITVASYGKSVTNSVYFDVFYNVNGSSWPRMTVTALGPVSNVTLVDSIESSSTSATEAFASIAAAGTALHGKAYTSSGTSTQTAIYGAVWN